ncbi:MAG: adenosylcobinamide-GDP ribazoletransferase [Methylocella sp.]
MRYGSSLLIDFLICLRFATRLPLPSLSRETMPHSLARFSRAVGLLPAAGALLGAIAAGVLAAAALAFPALLAAPLSIATLILLSGALHEDGLADCADGFGGGATRERKLEIMRDSRVGAFGALALALSLYIRIVALAFIAAQSVALASAVLIGAAAASRFSALIPMFVLPSARAEGAGFSAGRPEPPSFGRAACLAAIFAATPLLAGANLGKATLGLAASVIAGFGCSALAKRQIGGQTGDVAGAAQQISEIAFYLVFVARF